MIKLSTVLSILKSSDECIGFTNSPKSPESVLILLADGGSITYTPAPAPQPAALTKCVAYFGYPDSDGIGSASSRRVIVQFEDSRYIKGVETTDNNQFKTFLKRKCYALRFEQEPVND